MGLTAAAARPFVVSAADGTADRVRVEAELRRRGRRAALSPVETGTLVVCGNPGAALARAIDAVWRDMPEPRTRMSADLVAGAAAGPRAPLDLDEVGMADRTDDRDGLRLDVLHVPLGPVLSHWPAGLRVDLTLQGDVVQAAKAVAVDTADGTFWHEGRRAAHRLDSVARLLHVAGWDAAGERAAVLRDEALAGAPDVARRFHRFARRVGRSRALRWMTRNTADVDGWLRDIGAALEGRPAADRPGEPWPEVLARLPARLEGTDLGEARLIVAGLDPDLGSAADG
ncbi:hypothetical protein BZB76_3603 [Actinomadura pelletieri DSM 43383]|uniref:Uncharacterized protein n=1 Tax=Actinomadura pelletieri DSM 43383 TaxID=1120940 RepID=A0A495QQ34_9ACTN|nr:hypothetical protein [Actinomadura pelletieri]RKS75075.1 hypothetical protein BZB76_3603 [Actinomadura pelletieri DSM 43383]